MQAPHLSAWKECAPLIFVSAQLPVDSGGRVSSKEIAGQTIQALRNIETVLTNAALSLRDIVKITVWLRRPDDFPGFNESYANYLGESKPACTTVIGALIHPDALVQIEATAGKILV